MTSKSISYRPDIDGLRAIAVLCVLLYHLDGTWLSGGFIGVDVFFVISGYLITNLIFRELVETNNFRFANFYIRRARRLFPALGATFAICLVLAFYIFSPQHLGEFAQSLMYAVFSVSNFFFWNTVSYFDTASEYKPLLHTWSLSVEEQFYFLWPVTLVFLVKRAKPSAVAGFNIFVGLISLLLNHGFFSSPELITTWLEQADGGSSLDIQATVFYLLPFRVFEFAIGAALVFAPKQNISNYIAAMLFAIGLIMVLYSANYFDSQMNFPSFAGLLPCLGAGLMLYSGPKHRLSWLVSNRPMVGIGLISYSLYLIHCPVIVFYKYWNYQTLTTIEKFFIIGISLILAYLMYKFIEQPFRKSRAAPKNRNFLVSCAVSTVLLLGVSWNAFASNGWLWRFSPQVISQLSHKKGHYSEYFWENIRMLEGDFANNGKPKVVIIGDSMAADLINALVEGGAVEKLDLVSINLENHCRALFPLSSEQYKRLYSGGATRCQDQMDYLMSRTELFSQADSVILASYWWEFNYLDHIETTAKHLKSIGVPKVWVQGMKNQQSDGISFLAKHSFSSRLHKIRTPVNPHTTSINNQLKFRAKDYTYFDLLNQFCNELGCQRVTPNGYLIIFDGTHMTQQGAAMVGEYLQHEPWFKGLLNTRDN